MAKLEADPRITQGANFFVSLVDWMRRAALAVNERAPLNSPVFTGDPQAPTPANTDNDTSIATTAWVRSAMGTIMTALGFAASIANPGYVKFPSVLGGWIVQWSFNTVPVNVSTANSPSGYYGASYWTFPMAFPTGCSMVCPMVQDGSGQPTVAWNNVSASQVQLIVKNSVTGNINAGAISFGK